MIANLLNFIEEIINYLNKLEIILQQLSVCLQMANKQIIRKESIVILWKLRNYDDVYELFGVMVDHIRYY